MFWFRNRAIRKKVADDPAASNEDLVNKLRAWHIGWADLGEPDGGGLPAGWQIIVRNWGDGLCDALVISPPPGCGWRTAGELTSARKARRQALDEIRRHVAKAAGPR